MPPKSSRVLRRQLATASSLLAPAAAPAAKKPRKKKKKSLVKAATPKTPLDADAVAGYYAASVNGRAAQHARAAAAAALGW
jgi:hypothetical protein